MKSKQQFFTEIGLIMLSFIVCVFYILIGYLLAMLPNFEWFTFASVREWGLSLKLLDVLNWLIIYLSTPTIMIVTACIAYKQWQYDKFSELRKEIIEYESIYVKCTDDEKSTNNDINNALLDYINTLEKLAFRIRHKSIDIQIARTYLNAYIEELLTNQNLYNEIFSNESKEYYLDLKWLLQKLNHIK